MNFFGKEMNSCSRFQLLLEEYLEGTLDPPALHLSEMHLAGCAACRESVADSRSAAALLRDGFSPAALPSPSFPQRVTAAIRAAEEARFSASRLFWAPAEHFAARMALVTGLAAALLGAVVLQQALSAPAIAGDFTDVAAAHDLSPGSPSVPLDRDSVLRAITEGGYGQ